jgi:hypothetical protein
MALGLQAGFQRSGIKPIAIMDLDLFVYHQEKSTSHDTVFAAAGLAGLVLLPIVS